MERKERLSGEAESFLARWSRRKDEARHEAAAMPEVPSPPEQTTNDRPLESPPRLLTDVDMPPIDSLRYEDDWSGFLSPGVSEGLRGEALRRLFSSPELNVTDGLDSYSGDYTCFEALGATVTADMRHQIERLLEAAGSAEPSPDATVAASAVDGWPAAAPMETAGLGDVSPDPSEDAGG